MMDPLDDFLQHPPGLPIDPALEQTLARQTVSLLPRARRRRWPTVAAIAASIAIALVSAYFVARSLQMEVPAKKEFVEHPIDVPPKDKPLPPVEDPKPPIVAVKPTNPRELEWTAFDAADDADRVRLYFQAGDLYLDRLNDCESALRCYSQAIHYSEPHDLEFNPKDNWLVMALKRDHRKEK